MKGLVCDATQHGGKPSKSNHNTDNDDDHWCSDAAGALRGVERDPTDAKGHDGNPSNQDAKAFAAYTRFVAFDCLRVKLINLFGCCPRVLKLDFYHTSGRTAFDHLFDLIFEGIIHFAHPQSGIKGLYILSIGHSISTISQTFVWFLWLPPAPKKTVT